MDLTNLKESELCECYKIIVQGTKNVIAACRECQVRQLILNSSAGTVFDESSAIVDGDESMPFKWRNDDFLTDFKVQAESLILFANNIDGLLTCVLRPSNVFGPEDEDCVPLFINLTQSGLAKLFIGSVENMCDFTYCENVTHAIICVVKALDGRMISVAGKAFFITNLEPLPFSEFACLLLEGLGYERPSIKLPSGVIWYVLLIVKWTHKKLHGQGYNHHLLSRMLDLATRVRTFNCSAAQIHIGYKPVVSMEDAIKLTIDSCSQWTKDFSCCWDDGVEENSKANMFLGGGKIADILLWRNEKTTFSCFLAVAVLFYWFLLSGKSFVSSLSQLLLLVACCLYGRGMLEISGATVPEIPSSWFEVHDQSVKELMISLVGGWNHAVYFTRSLTQFHDWQRFFKAAFLLYCLKLTLSQPLKVILWKVVVFSFTAFFVYEQYESEIDGLSLFLMETLQQLGDVMRNLVDSLGSYCQRKIPFLHIDDHCS